MRIDEQEKTLYDEIRERFRIGYTEEDIPLIHIAIDAGVGFRDALDILADATVDAWVACEKDDPDGYDWDDDFDEEDDAYWGDDFDEGYDLEDEIDRPETDLMAHGRLW